MSALPKQRGRWREIAIAIPDNKRLTTGAVVIGHWAIHPTAMFNLLSKQQYWSDDTYTITHVPTGYAVGRTLSAYDAIVCARTMNAATAHLSQPTVTHGDDWEAFKAVAKVAAYKLLDGGYMRRPVW
jgi:hypothetical protein